MQTTNSCASAELLRLLEGAVENAGLLRGDYFTICDWLEIADYAEAEGLTGHAEAIGTRLKRRSARV